MRGKVRFRLPALLASILLIVCPQICFAQAGANYMSSGGTGTYGNTSNLTGKQATQTQTQGNPNLNTASYGLLAPGSVDTTPVPSGQFSYGQPMAGTYPYQGVDGGGGGGMLSPTAMSSMNFNSVDCPFIRAPGEGDGTFGGIGGGSAAGGQIGANPGAFINEYATQPTQANPATTTNASTNLNADQQHTNLVNFFNTQ